MVSYTACIKPTEYLKIYTQNPNEAVILRDCKVNSNISQESTCII
jgi:hypothetical protein